MMVSLARCMLLVSRDEKYVHQSQEKDSLGEALFATEHKPVVHAVCLRGRLKTSQVESEKTGSKFTLYARTGKMIMRDVVLSSPGCMLLLCSLKGGSVITGPREPHGKDDSHPDVGKGTDSDGMAFSFRSF